MKNTWNEILANMKEIRTMVERDLVLRRYHMWMQGQTPFEDRLMDLVTKIRFQFLASWRSMMKRTFDIAFSFFAILLALPVMGIIALAIKFDSRGPVIYRQTRVGKKGRPFEIFKFRTMAQDAENLSGPVWAKENDARVTRIGEFLRKTHLDELPQFFNVLMGDMSIVGPRPERPYFVNEFRRLIPHYDRRLCAKPGITGLAQIKRRYDESLADVKRKLRYDVLYIHKMCPLLDMKVIFQTFGTVVLRTGR